ncbi:MAG: hypothetical protein EAZ74_05190 [Alphaproteobacteria bacterium]|nr:MAG: hypothetical protein EAY76_03870 [Alphaproteobacteria bacterium]TAF13701.1 MAG: hypothetical protein EAZ74_05190 [Alphaproteobacteria bacterium]TAF38345.1 MAG: hypothetical protein EAZ66_06440 [Alphaproteobacteria bacterium]TAF76260.1 MAG: hypothetical protein EAZ52_04220 [Alphaproteobacteria bacterium]
METISHLLQTRLQNHTLEICWNIILIILKHKLKMC